MKTAVSFMSGDSRDQGSQEGRNSKKNTDQVAVADDSDDLNEEDEQIALQFKNHRFESAKLSCSFKNANDPIYTITSAAFAEDSENYVQDTRNHDGGGGQVKGEGADGGMQVKVQEAADQDMKEHKELHRAYLENSNIDTTKSPIDSVRLQHSNDPEKVEQQSFICQNSTGIAQNLRHDLNKSKQQNVEKNYKKILQEGQDETSRKNSAIQPIYKTIIANNLQQASNSLSPLSLKPQITKKPQNGHRKLIKNPKTTRSGYSPAVLQVVGVQLGAPKNGQKNDVLTETGPISKKRQDCFSPQLKKNKQMKKNQGFQYCQKKHQQGAISANNSILRDPYGQTLVVDVLSVTDKKLNNKISKSHIEKNSNFKGNQVLNNFINQLASQNTTLNKGSLLSDGLSVIQPEIDSNLTSNNLYKFIDENIKQNQFQMHKNQDIDDNQSLKQLNKRKNQSQIEKLYTNSQRISQNSNIQSNAQVDLQNTVNHRNQVRNLNIKNITFQKPQLDNEKMPIESTFQSESVAADGISEQTKSYRNISNLNQKQLKKVQKRLYQRSHSNAGEITYKIHERKQEKKEISDIKHLKNSVDNLANNNDFSLNVSEKSTKKYFQDKPFILQDYSSKSKKVNQEFREQRAVYNKSDAMKFSPNLVRPSGFDFLISQIQNLRLVKDQHKCSATQGLLEGLKRTQNKSKSIDNIASKRRQSANKSNLSEASAAPRNIFQLKDDFLEILSNESERQNIANDKFLTAIVNNNLIVNKLIQDNINLPRGNPILKESPFSRFNMQYQQTQLAQFRSKFCRTPEITDMRTQKNELDKDKQDDINSPTQRDQSQTPLDIHLATGRDCQHPASLFEFGQQSLPEQITQVRISELENQEINNGSTETLQQRALNDSKNAINNQQINQESFDKFEKKGLSHRGERSNLLKGLSDFHGESRSMDQNGEESFKINGANEIQFSETFQSMMNQQIKQLNQQIQQLRHETTENLIKIQDCWQLNNDSNQDNLNAQQIIEAIKTQNQQYRQNQELLLRKLKLFKKFLTSLTEYHNTLKIQMAQKLAEARSECQSLKAQLSKQDKLVNNKISQIDEIRNKHRVELEHQMRLQEQAWKKHIEQHQNPMRDLKILTDDLKAEVEKTRKELDVANQKLIMKNQSLQNARVQSQNQKQHIRTLEYVNHKNQSQLKQYQKMKNVKGLQKKNKHTQTHDSEKNVTMMSDITSMTQSVRVLGVRSGYFAPSKITKDLTHSNNGISTFKDVSLETDKQISDAHYQPTQKGTKVFDTPLGSYQSDEDQDENVRNQPSQLEAYPQLLTPNSNIQIMTQRNQLSNKSFQKVQNTVQTLKKQKKDYEITSVYNNQQLKFDSLRQSLIAPRINDLHERIGTTDSLVKGAENMTDIVTDQQFSQTSARRMRSHRNYGSSLNQSNSQPTINKPIQFKQKLIQISLKEFQQNDPKKAQKEIIQTNKSSICSKRASDSQDFSNNQEAVSAFPAQMKKDQENQLILSELAKILKCQKDILKDILMHSQQYNTFGGDQQTKNNLVNMQLLQIYKTALNRVSGGADGHSRSNSKDDLSPHLKANPSLSIKERQLVVVRIIQETALRDAMLKLIGRDPNTHSQSQNTSNSPQRTFKNQLIDSFNQQMGLSPEHILFK